VAGFAAAALPSLARAQLATQPPPKQGATDEFSVTAPVSIEVNARPIPSFDPRDRSRVRFGSLEYRSGLVLTSRFRGFGGFRGSPPHQLLPQHLHGQSGSGQMLTETVMKIVAKTAPLTPAHFQKLPLQTLAFHDLLAQVRCAIQHASLEPQGERPDVIEHVDQDGVKNESHHPVPHRNQPT